MGSPSKGFSVLSVVFYHLFPRGWEEELVVFRVAKCQFFTQIISVQLNLPKEKESKLREVFDF